MWKAGQCVTIKGKRYRVKSAQQRHLACSSCALDCRPYGAIFIPYWTLFDCDRICFSKERKLGDYQYLEEIQAKKKS